jgi:hypothetical protein
VGGRLIELSGREYMVRGRGYVKNVGDLEQIVLKTDERGTPVLLRDVGQVALGPEIRRGVSDLDGLGDAVGGIVVMRHAENARAVIERIKARLAEVEPSLPKGVRIVTTYDRSDLIQRSIDNLKHELLLEMLIVSLVILVFLLAHPFRDRPHHHDPGLGAAGLRPDDVPGYLLERDVAGGNRHLHRRPGRRRHRRGGERLQEARAVGARRPSG